MLVLSRKRNERIVIRNDIEVTVVAINGGRVKLGFSAPSEVPIRREELQDSMAAEAIVDLEDAQTVTLAR